MWRYSKEQFGLALFYLFALFVNRLPPSSTFVCNLFMLMLLSMQNCEFFVSSDSPLYWCILIVVGCLHKSWLLWVVKFSFDNTMMKCLLHLYPDSLLCIQFFRSSLSLARKDNMCKTEKIPTYCTEFSDLCSFLLPVGCCSIFKQEIWSAVVSQTKKWAIP
jgi:hypothetical protein